MTPTKPIPQHVLAYLSTQAWAMHAPVLERMARVVLRQPEVADLADAELADPKASVALRYGEPHEQAQATVREGVATLAITGPLMRYADFFTLMCGGATYETLAADLGCLAADAAVHTIVLDIDSPGGEVNGCGELAALIAQIATTKPVIAFVSGLGCSAAYWLASACSEVVVAETAIVGSLGCRFVYTDDSARAEAEGIKTIQIVSSQSPGKAHDDPTTPEGLAATQRLADSLAAVFLETVAGYRGVPVASLLAGTYAGGTVVGLQAVTAGLADRVSTAEQLHAELATRTLSPTRAVARDRGPSMSTRPTRPGAPAPLAAAFAAEQQVTTLVARDVVIPEGAVGTVVEVAEGVIAYGVQFEGGEYRWLAEQELAAVDAPSADPAAAPQAMTVAAIRAAAAAEERTRILAIQTLATPESSAVVAQAIADGVSVQEAAHRILLATPKRNEARLAALAGDDAEAPAARSVNPAKPTSEQATIERILSAGKPAPSQR
jgi:capsid assembly protease